MKRIKMLVGAFAIFGIVGAGFPAAAFHLEMPKELKDLNSRQKVLGTKLAQLDENSGQPANGESAPQTDASSEPQDQPADSGNANLPLNEPKPFQSNPEQPGSTCRIDGVEKPGACESYSNNNQGQNGQPGGQNDEQYKKDQERRLRDYKRGVKNLEMNIKRVESMLKRNAGKKGLSSEDKEKISKVKEKIEKIKKTESTEELENMDMGELQEEVESLEGDRMEAVEDERRTDDIKKGIKDMERGIKMFEAQIAKLAKKKITVPAEITKAIKEAKVILEAIKNAKTYEEMEAAGVEDLRDLMMTLEENRETLENLFRWQETLKNVEREFNRINKEVKNRLGLIGKLKKQGIDLWDEYNLAKEAVANLKTAKDEAVALMKAGQAEDAFDMLESEFFGQMPDAWQNFEIIMTMSNLGRFQSEFKRQITDAQKVIRQLKKKKINTRELDVALNEINNLGKEIIALLKKKPLDADLILDKIQELESLAAEYDGLEAELTGEEEDEMPWEDGGEEVKSLDIDWSVLPKKKAEDGKADDGAAGENG
ncbi:MAG: hypothetical protein WC745_05470 [Patescibacteria group bacterium]|jgi:hypothetical protein